MAETRSNLRSKNKSIDIREALDLIENPETRGVTNLPIVGRKLLVTSDMGFFFFFFLHRFG